MKANEKLQRKFEQGLHICVGLDTDINKIPHHLRTAENPVLEFNKIIIENTAGSAAAFKINTAFYEKDGKAGLETLEQTLALIPSDVLTIGDAKRGDIGNTSQMYAEAVFDHLGFDSVTLHPYMGYDSLSPFLEYKNKLNFILGLTSNKGASDFEKLELKEGGYLFQKVIEKVNAWNTAGNCGIVFGATNPEELRSTIDSFGSLVVLIPGVGAQGGSLEEVAGIFEARKNKNYLVNVSRALIYADDSMNFGKTAAETLENYNQTVFGCIRKDI